MLMERDKELLKYLELYNCITIKQAAKNFYRDTVNSYTNARKRLRLLEKQDLLRYYTNRLTEEKVYYLPGGKQVGSHELLLMNVYAEFVSNNIEILKFKKEYSFMDDKYRCDGFFELKYPNNKKRIVIVEIDMTHKTDFNKYEKIYESGEIQETYKVFPPIIVVTEFNHRYQGNLFKVKYLDFNLTNFNQELLIG